MRIIIELKNEKVSNDLKEIFEHNKDILKDKPIIMIFPEAIKDIRIEDND